MTSKTKTEVKTEAKTDAKTKTKLENDENAVEEKSKKVAMREGSETKHELGEFQVPFLHKSVKFTAEEGVLFSRLFHLVDFDGDGFIEGNEGAAFIRRAHLSNNLNREIWRLASGGKSSRRLNKDGWFVAMKLTSLAQQCGSCSLEPLYDGKAMPLPDFKYDGPPDSTDNSGTTEIVPPFTIRVCNPVNIGKGYNKYTQYSVEMTTSKTNFPVAKCQVYRRFSDFEWLYNRLRLRFKGSIVPPLPEKRWTGNMEAAFIEERRQGLEHFLTEVCSHPKLSLTLEVQVVLTCTNEGMVDAKQLMPLGTTHAYIPTTAAVTSVWGMVKGGWIAAAAPGQQVEIKTDEDYNKIGGHIGDYEKRIQSIVAASDTWYQAQRSQGYEMCRFGNYLSDLSAVERHQADAAAFLTLDQLLAQYVTPIKYQADKIESVKRVMHNREEAINEVYQANASMQRNKERFAAARAINSAAASAVVAEQKLASAENRMHVAKEQVDFIASSLKVESKLFDMDKNKKFRTCLLALTESQLTYRRKSRMAWEELIQKLNVDPQILCERKQRLDQVIAFRKPGEKPSLDPGSMMGIL